MSASLFNVEKVAVLPRPAWNSHEHVRRNSTDHRIKEEDAIIQNEYLVDIIVGDLENITFSVHKHLLLSRSPSFDDFRVSFNASLDCRDTYVVNGVEPEDFRRYLNLVYANQLATKGPGEWQKLCRLFLLSERLQDIAAKNTVVDGMYAFLLEQFSGDSSASKSVSNLPAQVTKELYNGTSAGCQVRKLIVDVYANLAHESLLHAGHGILPVELVYEVAARLMELRGLFVFGSFTNRPASWYHEERAVPGSPRSACNVTPPNTPPNPVTTGSDTATAKRSDMLAHSGLAAPKRTPHSLEIPPSMGKIALGTEVVVPKLETVTVQALASTKPPANTPRSSIFGIDWKTIRTDPAPGDNNARSPQQQVKFKF